MNPDEGYRGRAFMNDDVEEVARLQLFSSYYLFRAVSFGSVRCIDRILAERPALVDERDRYGDCPLHSCQNRPQVARVLLQHGANVNARTEGDPQWEYYNCTLLHMCDDQLARCKGSDEEFPILCRTIRLLIDYGAHLPDDSHSSFTRTYYTARQSALAARRDAAVALYLAQGARHPWAPRDMLRELARAVLCCGWRAWMPADE